jgi:hypothetical protein
MSDTEVQIEAPLDHAASSANPPTPKERGPTPILNQDAPSLTVAVVWGDLTQVEADVHVVGHYQGVTPSGAELMLDRAISAGPRPLIAEHTRRGWIKADLGEVAYFPSQGGTVRRAAVVGMGRLGTFSERRAEQMHASALGELLTLGYARTAAMVLIGSGAGNLSIGQSCRALADGFGLALGAATRTHDGSSALAEVLLVEVDRLRAEQLFRALRQACQQVPAIQVAPELRTGPGGGLARSSAAVYAVAELAKLAGKGGPPAAALDGVLDGVPPDVREIVREQLVALADVEPVDMAVTVRATGPSQDAVPPIRISVLPGEMGLRWAALTERATVPERHVPVNARLLDQLVDRLTEPTADDANELPDLLSRLVVPLDFQRLISPDACVILELDRDTAVVPWEFLTDAASDTGAARSPLVVRTPVSRQLRTAYSRVVLDELAGKPPRALVVGDPGDPEQGMDLPGARREALEVAAELRRMKLDRVDVFIGAPNASREPEFEPATRLDVLKALLRDEYHILHYCGHGTFDPAGGNGGWVFADGLLTAHELAQLSRPPRLVVANACYSARLGADTTAQPPGPTSYKRNIRPEAALTPTLADEFLRVGVTHYVGAAWQVPDEQGVTFAASLYRELLKALPGEEPATVGEAVRVARKAVFDEGRASPGDADGGLRWSAWAAYQHYGDPTELFVGSPRRERERRYGR